MKIDQMLVGTVNENKKLTRKKTEQNIEKQGDQ